MHASQGDTSGLHQTTVADDFPAGVGEAVQRLGHDLLFLLTDDGVISSANRKAVEVIARPRNEVVNRPLRDFVHAGDRIILEGDDVVGTLNTIDGTHVDLRIHVGDGRYQLVSGTMTDLREDPKFSSILLSLRPVGEPAKQVANRQLLLHAVEAANSSIVIAQAGTDDLPLVYANSGFRQITGYDEDEIVGKNCRFLQARDGDAGHRDEANTAEHADDEIDQARASGRFAKESRSESS